MRADQEAQDPHDFDLLSRELVLSSLVHEVTRVMLGASTLPQALHSFLLGITELTGVQSMVLYSLPDRDAELEAVESLGLSQPVLERTRPTLAAPSIYGCLASHRHILVEKLEEGDPFLPTGADSYMVMPISAPVAASGPDGQSRLRPLAVLWLDTSPPSPELTGQAISHLAGLAQQAGLMMENFRVQRELASANSELQTSHAKLNQAYAALTRAQKILDQDLDRARSIQSSLLPESIPKHLLRGSAARYVPAGKVGGDYYDCFELEPGTLGLVVADVSGHGMAAALVMSMFKVLLRTFSAQTRSPTEVLNRINRVFIEQLGGANFVTAFYAVFDQGSRQLTYCNAGHVAQLIQQDPVDGPAEMVELASQGLVLGVFADTHLHDSSLQLGPLARLFLFTDGITEAHSQDDKMFGTEPLKAQAAPDARSPKAVLEGIFQALEEFTRLDASRPGDTGGGFSLVDDATLAILDL